MTCGLSITQGDGDVATALKGKRIVGNGFFASKDDQGASFISAKLVLTDDNGEEIAAGEGSNVSKSRAVLSFEEFERARHTFELNCELD